MICCALAAMVISYIVWGIEGFRSRFLDRDYVPSYRRPKQSSAWRPGDIATPGLAAPMGRIDGPSTGIWRFAPSLSLSRAQIAATATFGLVTLGALLNYGVNASFAADEQADLLAFFEAHNAICRTLGIGS